MKYDPRIKSIDSIRNFNTNNYDCLGKFGYFTNFVENFKDLNIVRKGICVFKDGSRFPFYEGDQSFQYFIPEKDLVPKEKKYRPYTLNEFLNTFPIGESIKFRRKERVGWECYLILNGYRYEQHNDQTITFIYIGSYPYTFDQLFKDYEWQNLCTGEWQKFGVEVEE